MKKRPRGHPISLHFFLRLDIYQLYDSEYHVTLRCRFIMKNFITFLLLILGLSDLHAQSFTNPMAIPPLVTGNQFTLSVAQGSGQFYPGITTNNLFLINGNYLGPTLEFIQNDTVEINVINNLNEVTTMHWHGLHVPAIYDGGPHIEIPAGTTWTPRFKVLNKAATYWYHAHTHMLTQSHVTRGMAGLIIVRDTEEAQLNLPRTYGIDDFPIIIQDRRYSPSGNFQLAALGDSVLINGTANAYLDLPAQVVRLRLLNGSNARVYNLGFSDNRSFQVIASDGSLIDQPSTMNRLTIANGERFEILLDLSGQQGNSFTLWSYATEMMSDIPGAVQGMGMDNSYLNGVDFPLFQINVVAPSANPVTSVPSSLINIQPVDTTGTARSRFKVLSGQGMISMGNFFIAGQQFDINVINDTIILNDKELWEFVNVSNLAHPIHLHDIQFRILQRNGNPPPLHESGWKDVVLVHSMESVKLSMRFETYSNNTIPYMYHCHNLAHEDMGMMLSFAVIDTSSASSVHEVNGNSLSVSYTGEDWIIKHDLKGPVAVEVSDISGRRISALKFSANQTTLAVSHYSLPPGIYFIRLFDSFNNFTLKTVK
jgi:bilirubin oxidase